MIFKCGLISEGISLCRNSQIFSCQPRGIFSRVNFAACYNIFSAVFSDKVMIFKGIFHYGPILKKVCQITTYPQLFHFKLKVEDSSAVAHFVENGTKWKYLLRLATFTNHKIWYRLHIDLSNTQWPQGGV
jgi:hypothetical protein